MLLLFQVLIFLFLCFQNLAPLLLSPTPSSPKGTSLPNTGFITHREVRPSVSHRALLTLGEIIYIKLGTAPGM